MRPRSFDCVIRNQNIPTIPPPMRASTPLKSVRATSVTATPKKLIRHPLTAFCPNRHSAPKITAKTAGLMP